MGWHDQRRLVSLRTEYETLVLEARRLKVPVSGESDSAKLRLSEREQDEREEKVRRFADQLIDFVNRMEEQGGKEGEEMEREMIEIMEGMLALDAKELALLVAEVRGRSDLDEESRDGLIGFSLIMLSEHSPRAALTIFSETADLLGEDGEAEWMVSAALTNWAKSDPLEAMEWIRKNAAAHPELIQEGAKESVVAGASVTDPELALQLIGELELSLDHNLANELAQACRGVDERTALLNVIRGAGDALDLREKGIFLEQLADPLADEGFEEASTWLQQMDLSEDELAAFSSGLDYRNIRGEGEEWINWFGEHLEGQALRRRVASVVDQWTKEDYPAAGTWLSGLEDGPVREAAVFGYAETVVAHDPAAAVEWARTLAEGDDRDHLMAQAYKHMLDGDPAAAEALALAEGLPLPEQAADPASGDGATPAP